MPKPRVRKIVIKCEHLEELKDKLSGKNKPVELSITQKFKDQLKKLLGMKQ